MRAQVLEGPGSQAKAAGVVRALNSIWSGTVLDVGCRSRELETALAHYPISYVGLDIDDSGDIQADVGREIPLGEDAVDIVVALDVLEHADDIHRAFDEVCRVAQHNVVITLPNCYELGARIRHLRGRPISGKYGLPPETPADRHRWFFSLEEARSFVSDRAQRNNWSVTEQYSLIGPRRGKLSGLVERWPNLLAPTYLIHLTPK